MTDDEQQLLILLKKVKHEGGRQALQSMMGWVDICIEGSPKEADQWEIIQDFLDDWFFSYYATAEEKQIYDRAADSFE